MAPRDDFSIDVVRRLASRAGHICSNPGCRRTTSGPDATTDKSVNIGVGAHITAAAPGGPRYDPLLTPAQRASAPNGIWLCQWCGKLVDADAVGFPRDLLDKWKAAAEAHAATALAVPERPERLDEPILTVPAGDMEGSWLSYAARATTFVGRLEEQGAIDAFLQAGAPFVWWLVTGAAGSGKSRLALETCLRVRPAWSAGFLSRADKFQDWSRFRPAVPMLIVIDYVAGRAAPTSDMLLQLARSAQHLPHPVRVLLLERDEGAWWSRLQRLDSTTEAAELRRAQFAAPLRLGPLSGSDLMRVAGGLAETLGSSWTLARQREVEARMLAIDSLGRPLVAMIAAAQIEGGAPDALVSVLQVVVAREQARWKLQIPDDGVRGGLEHLIALATLTGGLRARATGFRHVSESDAGSLLPQVDALDARVYGSLVGSVPDGAILPGLQPDLVGERFVLDRLLGKDGFGAATRRMLLAAWSFQPEDLCEFIVRTASDYRGDPALAPMCSLPLESPPSRASWARLVAELVRVAGRSDDGLSQSLMTQLRGLYERHADEVEVRGGLARAEFNLGNTLLLVERSHEAAASRFEVAIALAGPGSDVAIAAINNRGILKHELDEEESAFADWTAVINDRSAGDEVRACALNNRADVFARRAEYEAAIRDRTAVLSLRETSPDRRYIALSRRSDSRVAVGHVAAALADLNGVLATADISPEQKAEARVALARILIRMERWSEAREHLETALAEEFVFPGTWPAALVALAEVARATRDPDRARQYLTDAIEARDARDRTRIEALLVRGRISTDAGDVAGADAVWQSVLASRVASDRQRAIAAAQGVESRLAAD